MEVAGIEIPSDSPAFLSILAIHVPLGLLAVVTGAIAMLKEKRRGGHTRFGSIYFWSLGALFVTSTALAAMRWSDDYHLFVLGALAFAAAILGREVRRRRWNMRVDLHVVAMGVSYIAMITAFYVDNGKNLPLWRDLPCAAYWLIPSAVGIPLIVRALAREPKLVIRAQGAAH
ncbi:MAG TPA: DUF2306 domain-containing protein [Patescibacteria group bacterium]|nr:DUF2306 domain-containing protein [Patescibacteria group bacterium]